MPRHLDSDLWTAIVAHGALSVGLLYAPLLIAADQSPPGAPLFGGLASVLMPVYYLGVLVVIAAPSVQSMRSPPDPAGGRDATFEDGPVGELQRRYVEEDVSEAEFEQRLERLLEE